MLEMKGLCKSFGKKAVLRDLHFRFDSGVYGLLGPNGAGKTTLLRCIAGLYPVKKSTLFYNGTPVEKNKGYLAQIGYLPQNFGLFKELSVRDMLLLMANLKGMDKKSALPQVEKAAAQANLSEHLDQKSQSLSGGMVRRLGVAQALLGDPGILLFDEPTAGLDPEERLRFKNMIAGLPKDKTIIISTHIVADVESLCDSVAIMKAGNIVLCDSCRGLENLAQGKAFVLPESEAASLEGDCYIERHFEQNGRRYIRVLASDMNAPCAEPDVEDGYLCVLRDI